MSNIDLTKISYIKKLLLQTKDRSEWNKCISLIKTANGNSLPSFWRDEIILSGFYEEIEQKWSYRNKY